MGITVDFKPDGGVVINRYEKNQQMFVPFTCWMQLLALKDTIQEKLESKKEDKWSIGHSLYVNTSLFNGDVYLNIRMWRNDKPTKQGVTMCIPEWNHLYSFLQFDDETNLGVDIFKAMLTEGIHTFINTNCEGCQQNWSSQKDHACLMDASSTAKSCIDDLFDSINAFEFITRLAKDAEAKKILLKRPFITFCLVKNLKEDELKLSTLSKYDF
jgi:hypothetical protein